MMACSLTPSARRHAPACILAGVVAFLWLGATTPVAAQGLSGEWITIGGEITTDVYNRVKGDIERAIKRGAKKIVIHFQQRELSDFGPCNDLAKYLLERIEGRAITAAYFDKPLLGHAVLPVLACKFVYLAPDANLGFDARSLERAGLIDPSIAAAYMRVGNSRGRPVPLLLKMLKPELTVFRHENNGLQFRLDPRQVEPLNLGIDQRFQRGPADEPFRPIDFLKPGALGLYSARDAEAWGLINRTFATRQQMLESLGLPASLASGKTTLPDQPKAAWIELKGEIYGGTFDIIQDKVRRAIAQEVHLIILEMEEVTGGPETVAKADELARFLRDKTQPATSLPNGILTVAYVPKNLSGAAHFVAFACDHIVLGPAARIGDCTSLVYKAQNQPFDEDKVKPIKERLMRLAEQAGHSPVLVRGFFEPDLEIVLAQPKPNPDQPRDLVAGVVLLPKNELGDKWEAIPGQQPVKKKGKLLALEAKQANDLGVARAVLQVADMGSVFSLYGIDGERNVIRMSPTWLDNLSALLQHPLSTVLLVVIGFTCLILELKAPGMTAPGVIAALCILLLFWAHTWLAGEINALAILLFLLGLVLLAVELFVLPGFGITGISGVVLMLLGLSLLIVRQWPQTQAEYMDLGTNFGIFTGCLALALIGAFSIARFLPHIPFANKMILLPPDEVDGGGAATLAPAVSPKLLGAVGTAVTELRPAGKAAFGDQYVDVVAESGYVASGARVQVIEIDGLRVVVKTV